MTNTRVYKIWAGMNSRCSIPSASGFADYGGRGIRVCERWRSFELFLADMGEPEPGQSIERNDGSRDYEPGNCRWASRLEQNRNQRDLVYLTFNGKTQCVSAWAEECGVKADTIRGRIDRGWTPERALSTPTRAHKVYARSAK